MSRLSVVKLLTIRYMGVLNYVLLLLWSIEVVSLLVLLLDIISRFINAKNIHLLVDLLTMEHNINIHAS